jgi:hypothetical protein
MSIAVAAARAAQLAAAVEGKNPFVAFDNLAALATLGGTAVKADGARANAVTGTTYDYWKPDVAATTAQFQVTFPTARTLSFVGTAAHNLGTLGATVSVQRSINGGANWSDAGAGAIVASDNKPLAFRMATSGNDAANWRINISGLTVGADVFAGVLFFGSELVMPSRFYAGFAPAIVPTEVQLQSNVSVGGNLVGSQVIGQGSSLAAQLRHLNPAFIRGASFTSFMRHFNAGKGFFFGWRPTEYPDDLHYCWRDGGTLRPANMGIRDLMEFELSMRAYEA